MVPLAKQTLYILLTLSVCACSVPAGERSPAQKMIDALSPKPFDDPELEAAMKRGPEQAPDPDADLPSQVAGAGLPLDVKKLQQSIRRQLAEAQENRPAPQTASPRPSVAEPKPPPLTARHLPGVTGPTRPPSPIAGE